MGLAPSLCCNLLLRLLTMWLVNLFLHSLWHCILKLQGQSLETLSLPVLASLWLDTETSESLPFRCFYTLTRLSFIDYRYAINMCSMKTFACLLIEMNLPVFGFLVSTSQGESTVVHTKTFIAFKYQTALTVTAFLFCILTGHFRKRHERAVF